MLYVLRHLCCYSEWIMICNSKVSESVVRQLCRVIHHCCWYLQLCWMRTARLAATDSFVSRARPSSRRRSLRCRVIQDSIKSRCAFRWQRQNGEYDKGDCSPFVAQVIVQCAAFACLTYHLLFGNVLHLTNWTLIGANLMAGGFSTQDFCRPTKGLNLELCVQRARGTRSIHICFSFNKIFRWTQSLEAFEIWIWRGMMKIRWMDMKKCQLK